MRVPFLDLARDTAIDPDVAAAVTRVVASGRYILGPELRAFEDEWAAYCQTTQAVGVGNGLEALALALRAAGVGPGHDVLVPSNTFIATWLAVDQVGANVVPVEPDLRSGLVTPEAFLRARTPRTRAVIPVHLAGAMASVRPLVDAAGANDWFVLEDAAQAHGAWSDDGRAGSLGHAAAFSFYPAKNLGAVGDGGAVTTSDPALADRVRLLRNYGSVEKYDHAIAAGNSRLDDIQAAVLRAKLPKLEKANQARSRIAALYDQGLSGTEGLELPLSEPGMVHYTYVIRHAARNKLKALLDQAGVGTQVFYPVPPHRSGAYVERVKGDFPVADKLAGTSLALPIGPYLTDEEISHVMSAVREASARLVETRPEPPTSARF